MNEHLDARPESVADLFAGQSAEVLEIMYANIQESVRESEQDLARIRAELDKRAAGVA